MSIIDRVMLAATPSVARASRVVDDVARGPGAVRPIVIQGGLATNRAAYGQLRALLRERGYEVHLSKLPRWGWAPIEQDAKMLEQTVKRVLRERPDVDKVTVLAHSKGGLSARWWIQEGDGLDHVSQLITLGSPHRGMAPVGERFTAAAMRRAPLPAAMRQFHDSSPEVTRLSAGLRDTIRAADLVNPEFRIVSIRGSAKPDTRHATDFIVSEHSATLPANLGPRLINHKVAGADHASIAAMGTANRKVLDLIDQYALGSRVSAPVRPG